MPITLIATAAFGLEATVKREVVKLGFPVAASDNGSIAFKADFTDIPKANIWLRSADRVLLVMGEFTAVTFDELFEGTKALPWGDYIPKNGRFTVTGKSVKSALFSVPDCQSIVKKAVVEKLKEKYRLDYFEETGAEYTIQAALRENKVTITVDTSGVGLHKRGYRASQAAAPIKETMAAALIELSYWRKDRILLDPFCGSGTIPIEAAMMARNIAPGLTRRFASERWEQVPVAAWSQERAAAKAAVKRGFMPKIYASDIDKEVLRMARLNAENVGVADCIEFSQKDIKDVKLPGEYGVLITNPPYGERMSELNDARVLYKSLGGLVKNEKSWSAYVVTADEDFERIFGKKADARRKLFSGALKIDYYQYFGKKPERSNHE
ncbi:MAG: class I SAM-dependent RNA methyltransferase [Clostridiales bacterium]|jgi:putative N6-adenine-specific DNA methylase|nr:class I SAM-dependent RNA methyltransferase [Clostridiales bacterium]